MPRETRSPQSRLCLRTTRTCAAICLVGILLGASSARANGRFPAASQIVHAGDRTAVRTTFGILVDVASDGRWGWVCEPAVGYAGIQDPMVGITGTGRFLAALDEGLAVSADGGCTWSFASTAPILDLSVDRIGQLDAVAVASDARLLLSPDGGDTWTLSPTLLPAVDVRTIDVAPGHPDRLYASGVDGGGWLFRSDDRGGAWSARAVPKTSALRAPYIAAVSPVDPNAVYVRIDGAPDDELLFTSDGGDSFQSLFKANGALLGFAIAPDGGTVAVADDLGVWRAPSASSAFSRVSALKAACLEWTRDEKTGASDADDVLYACADEGTDGFTIGRSRDGGDTFAPVLRHSELCGPLSCDATTSVGATCGPLWPMQRTLLGASDCRVEQPPSSGPWASGSGLAACALSPHADDAGSAFVGTVFASMMALLGIGRRRFRSRAA